MISLDKEEESDLFDMWQDCTPEVRAMFHNNFEEFKQNVKEKE